MSRRHSPPYKTRGLEDESDDSMLLDALRGLNLPNMPSSSKETPTIRILAVADVDLPSAAALAEYALRKDDNSIGGGNVDLCIACGSFCSDDNLLTNPRYLEGRSRQRMEHRLAGASGNIAHTRALRTREESAALEGLVSATLSQLESIVCRLVFIPGPNDPISIISQPPNTPPRRLTSNARNVHRHWLQLTPGLGCAGLMDETSIEPDAEDDGTGYIEAASRLLELANPNEQHYSSHPSLLAFDTPLSQTILLTEPSPPSREVQHDDTSSRNSYKHGGESLNDTDLFPREFLRFIDAPATQSQVLVNVSSGDEPYLSQRGNVSLIIPGSLRKSGDFCLINVGLCRNDNATSDVSTGCSSYNWRVNRVEFRNMREGSST